MFPTRENEHDWYILYSIVPIRNKEKLKIMEAQTQLSQTVHFYLFKENKYSFIFIFFQGNSHQPSQINTNIVSNEVMGLVVKFGFEQNLTTVKK